MPDATTHAYIGSYRRGGRLPIHIRLITDPDECPTVDLWLNGTTLKKTFQLPRRSGQNFSLWKFLDGDIIDGEYVAAIRYEHSAVQSTHYRYFKVSGGDPRGQVIGIQEIRRPLGRALVTINENGTVQIGYNPRVE